MAKKKQPARKQTKNQSMSKMKKQPMKGMSKDSCSC